MSHPWVLGSFTLCSLSASEGHETVQRGPLAWSGLCPGSTVQCVPPTTFQALGALLVSPFQNGGSQASERGSQEDSCVGCPAPGPASPLHWPKETHSCRGTRNHAPKTGTPVAPCGSTSHWPDPTLTPFPQKAPQELLSQPRSQREAKTKTWVTAGRAEC